MSVSAAQSAAFFAEVLASGDVFGIKNADGFPAPRNRDGQRTMPFWSKRSRAEKVCASVAAYEGFDVVRLSLAEWRERWLPGLAQDDVRVGVNWSGPHATGYDLTPDDVERRLNTGESAGGPGGSPE